MPHNFQLPKIEKEPIYWEVFRYVGDEALPASSDLPSHWTGASFTTKDGFTLRALESGEVVYSGTSLDNLQIRNPSTKANYAITLVTVGRSNAKFAIRGRRQDANNYIEMLVSFPDQSIVIKKNIAGTVTEISSNPYQLDSDITKLYRFSLWMCNDDIIAMVNGQDAVSASIDDLSNKHGFSVNVPEIDESDPVAFSEIYISELSAQSAPGLDDDNLLVIFRNRIKSDIENPPERTWATYKKARMLWEYAKDIGFKDSDWESYGYPIAEPTPEQWFSN